MPKKYVHLIQAKHKGKRAHFLSVLLPNGNLVVPKIMERNPTIACWVEVEPGTRDFKWWHSKHETDHPDPRKMKGYLAQLKDADPDGKYSHTLKGVYKP